MWRVQELHTTMVWCGGQRKLTDKQSSDTEPSLYSCQSCQLSICWPQLTATVMGTNPIGHHQGGLTFIGCCGRRTDRQEPSPGWFKCGRAFMDVDKIDLCDITQTWGGNNNNNNSKDGVCLWSSEIPDCCLRGKSKARGSCSQSPIDWLYWNHFIVYRCSCACVPAEQPQLNQQPWSQGRTAESSQHGLFSIFSFFWFRFTRLEIWCLLLVGSFTASCQSGGKKKKDSPQHLPFYSCNHPNAPVSIDLWWWTVFKWEWEGKREGGGTAVVHISGRKGFWFDYTALFLHMHNNVNCFHLNQQYVQFDFYFHQSTVDYCDIIIILSPLMYVIWIMWKKSVICKLLANNPLG